MTQDKQLEEKYVITERKLRKILSCFLEEIEHNKLQRTGTSIEGKVIEWMDEKELLQSLTEHKQLEVWVKDVLELQIRWHKSHIKDFKEHNSSSIERIAYYEARLELLEEILEAINNHEQEQQPITNEAISAMAEKLYPSNLGRINGTSSNYYERKAFIKGFTSALQYSAGDNWNDEDLIDFHNFIFRHENKYLKMGEYLNEWKIFQNHPSNKNQ